MKKILLIEDDEFYTKTYKYGFEKAGYEMLTAENGDEGLKLLQSEKPDLVLLDLIMPVKDGFDFLKEIRANEALKDTPVIVLTVLAQEEDREACKKCGIDLYLVKTEHSLAEIIKKTEGVMKKRGILK